MINLITTKVELLLLISKQQEEFTTNDKEFKLISNYEELMKVISEVNKRPDENIFKFIYSYKNLIHSFTLYENEECININDFKLKNEFAEFYYLDRLILDEEEIGNYEYDHSFIKKVNEFFKMNDAKNDSKLQKVFISKIYFDIVKNFRYLDNYDKEINGKNVEIIKNEIDEVIAKNVDVFKEFDLDINEKNVKSIKNDYIYCYIIISLIKHNKFGDYNYLCNLIKEMDLEHINIGTIILNSLKETLDKNNDFMKQYLVESEEDLYNETKINFYYILFKFILKSSIFLYHIPFLVETRNIILNLIKFHKISYDELKGEIEVKLKFVLEAFSDSEHYFQNDNVIKEKINKLKEVLNYYQRYLFESKTNEIEQIEEHIRKKNIGSKFLIEYEKAVKANNFYPIIKNIYYTSNNKEIDSEKNLNNNFKNWETIYKMIKDYKYKKLKKKEIIYKLMIDEKSKDMFSRIFTKDEIDSFINHVKEIENKENKVQKEEKNDLQQIMEDSIIDDTDYFKDLNKTQPNNGEMEIQTEKNGSQQNDNSSINYIQHDEAHKSLSNIINLKINETLANHILYKCSIEFLNKKKYAKDFMKVDNIQCGANNQNIPVSEFDNFLYASLNSENVNTEMTKNCYKLAKFIEDFKKRIEEGFKNNYPLRVKLELTNTQQKDNDDSIYHFDALYTFYKPYTNKVKSFSYREENVLINGINTLEFNCKMDSINHEKCRNPIDEFISNSLYKKIAEGLLNKCTIEYVKEYYLNGPYLIIKAVNIGDNKEEIEIEKFKKFKYLAMDFENIDEEIFKNIYKIVKFINNFENKIQYKFKNEEVFHLTLELTNTKKINYDDLYVINASIIYDNPSTYEELYYAELNFLIKKENRVFSEFFEQGNGNANN